MKALSLVILVAACGSVEKAGGVDAGEPPREDSGVADASVDAEPVCNTKLAAIQFDAAASAFDIIVVNRDGSELVNITKSTANDTLPEWSPDGQRIAFVSTALGDGVHTMNPDGSGVQFVAPGGTQQQWSPDGQQLVFVRAGNIFIINANGTGETQLTTQGGTEPSWAPDGSKIVFVSNRDGDSEIFSMNPDGSAQTNLTANTEFDDDPIVSPDSSEVVFRTGATPQTTDIAIMNINGSGLTPLTAGGGQDANPEFSPDGTRVAFRASGPIRVVDASDGGNPIDIGNGNFPEFSPDGKEVSFNDSDTTGISVGDPNVADSAIPLTTDGNSSTIVWQPCQM